MSFATTLGDVRTEVYEALTVDNSTTGGLAPVSIQTFDHAPEASELDNGPICFLPRAGASIQRPRYTVPLVLFVGEYNPDPENTQPTVAAAQERFDQLLDEICNKLDETGLLWELDTGVTEPEGIYVATWKVSIDLPSVLA